MKPTRFMTNSEWVANALNRRERAKGQAQAKDQFSECMDDIFVSISISGRKEGKREGNSWGIKAHKEILGIIALNRTEMFG